MNERKQYRAALPSATEWAKVQADLHRARRRNQYHLRQIALLRVQLRGWRDLDASANRRLKEALENHNKTLKHLYETQDELRAERTSRSEWQRRAELAQDDRNRLLQQYLDQQPTWRDRLRWVAYGVATGSLLVTLGAAVVAAWRAAL